MFVGSTRCDSNAEAIGIEPTQAETLHSSRQQKLPNRMLPEGEDPAELPTDQRIRDLAQGEQRQPVVQVTWEIEQRVTAPCPRSTTCAWYG